MQNFKKNGIYKLIELHEFVNLQSSFNGKAVPRISIHTYIPKHQVFIFVKLQGEDIVSDSSRICLLFGLMFDYVLCLIRLKNRFSNLIRYSSVWL